MKHFIIVGFLFFSIFSSIEFAFAEESQKIPYWIKNYAGFWSQDKILDHDFKNGLKWLIKNNFIHQSNNYAYSYDQIPNWTKNISFYWSLNKISDHEFLNAFQYLTETNLVKIPYITSDYEINGLNKLVSEESSPLFDMYAFEKDLRIQNGIPVALEFQYELKPELMEKYDDIGNFDNNNIVVIVPLFTMSAYQKNGFYDFYNNNCDIECLTVTIDYNAPMGFSGSTNAVTILHLLGYDTLTDLDIDLNPDLLTNYDKVILLHNEYVTQKEFDAIINHPNVVYLYPNALHAKIDINYHDDTITLIRGHGYPHKNIVNGFDWKFDNTHPYEYDHDCMNWNFYEVSNGVMLNCYPEYILHINEILLKTIKEI